MVNTKEFYEKKISQLERTILCLTEEQQKLKKTEKSPDFWWINGFQHHISDHEREKVELIVSHNSQIERLLETTVAKDMHLKSIAALQHEIKILKAQNQQLVQKSQISISFRELEQLTNGLRKNLTDVKKEEDTLLSRELRGMTYAFEDCAFLVRGIVGVYVTIRVLRYMFS